MKPGEEPVEILLHVRLLDDGNLDQMKALGVVGPHGLTVTAPGTLRWNLYAGTAPEGVALQNAVPIAAGAAWMMRRPSWSSRASRSESKGASASSPQATRRAA